MVWQVGHQLQGGQYVIKKILGQAGFGTTYKALHMLLEQEVVIKTPNEYLKARPDYDKYVRRFIKEAQLLEKLSQYPHPHIVRVKNLFREGETYCIVMDFIPGENLFDIVRRLGLLPEAKAVKYIRQVGNALEFLHRAELVHRDAHPGNVMVQSDGRAVLIDFGIAKEITPSTSSSTNKAANEGFAPYEQIVSGSRKPTVDIYTLAATLYYTLTGQRPSTSLERKLNDTPLIPPKQIIPEINDLLNQAILEGMALEAENRPQSIREWLEMLKTSEEIEIQRQVLYQRQQDEQKMQGAIGVIVFVGAIFFLFFMSSVFFKQPMTGTSDYFKGDEGSKFTIQILFLQKDQYKARKIASIVKQITNKEPQLQPVSRNYLLTKLAEPNGNEVRYYELTETKAANELVKAIKSKDSSVNIKPRKAMSETLNSLAIIIGTDD